MKMSERAERLKRLTPSLKCTKLYDKDWLVDCGPGTTFVLYLESEVYVDICEIDDKTDEEVKDLIRKKMCSVLKDALKELGEEKW